MARRLSRGKAVALLALADAGWWIGWWGAHPNARPLMLVLAIVVTLLFAALIGFKYRKPVARSGEGTQGNKNGTA
jgi:hypothetical protein